MVSVETLGVPGYGSIAPSILEEEDPPMRSSSRLDVSKSSKSRWASIFALLVVCCAAVILNDGGNHPGAANVNLKYASIIEVDIAPDMGKEDDINFLTDSRMDDVALFYDEQLLDHIHKDTEIDGVELKTWSQRYFKTSRHWKGPGHPILVIMGGEDALDEEMLYPYVYEGLADAFGAFVFSPEHRFYGESQPVLDPTVDDLIAFLSPDQALLDTINLIQYIRQGLGCSKNQQSKNYCPVVTFGGSYPGFLSAMLRFRFPDIVDIAYASSAPLLLYSQQVDSRAYNDKVTEVADIASPGCADAIRSSLYAVEDELLTDYTSVVAAAEATGFCTDTFPTYMKDIPEFISEAITFLVPAIFADFNMAYYPPGPETALAKACALFEDGDLSPLEKLSGFFDLRGLVEYGEENPVCFDIALELPSGPNARIRGSDNSGSGGGFTGEIWEFQCCKDLIIPAGYSKESMFLPRSFSYEWHADYCHRRFPGVPVNPYRMVDEWKFDDLSHASHILFMNGLRDGWSTSSILQTSNPNLAVINMPNGAHHSDLTQVWPNPLDTPDVVRAQKEAKKILRGWLDELHGYEIN